MQIRLFGEVTVGDAEDGALGNGRPAAILVLLALRAGGVLPIERLIDQLWVDGPPRDAVHAVRVYISRLRTRLAAAGTTAAVVTRSGGYALDVARDQVDVLAFEDLAARGLAESDAVEALAQLEQALEMWHAEPLVGFAYEEFALSLRARLEQVRRDCRRRWAELAIEAGRRDEVLATVRRALADDPVQEGLWTVLVGALLDAGRTTEATAALAQARDALAPAGEPVGPELAEIASRLSPEVAPVDHDGARLPAPVDALFGRDRELEVLGAVIATRRLTTLTGAGGCGKTRLATELAERSRERFDDRVWFVDLTTAEPAASVPDVIVQALRLGQGRPGGPLESLCSFIGDTEALLLLDNCEHMIEQTAEAVQVLLRRCPRLRVLTTTREPLRIPGEHVFIVPSLAVPPLDADLTAAADTAAVALFVDRSRGADPAFALTTDVLPSVVRITRVLDGIPLAIELAAVRVRTLSVAQIAQRLGDVFAALGAGSRTALPRHRTLEAALHWSFDLLDADEREMFVSVGVLRGAFDIRAAAAVVASQDFPRVEVTLATLVEKSVVAALRGAESRYRLLEPIRQYAERRSDAGGSGVAARLRRDEFFAALVEEAGRGRRRFEIAEWRRRVRAARANILAMIDSLLVRGDSERAADVVIVVTRFWLEFGFYDEGRRLIGAVLRPPQTPERVAALRVQDAWLASHQGDYAHAIGSATSAVEAAEACGARGTQASALNALGSLAAEQGDMRSATDLLERARRVSVDDAPDIHLRATVNLASVHAWAGRVRDAAAVTATFLPTGETALRQLAIAIDGVAARIDGDLERSARRLDEALAMIDEGGSAFHRSLFIVERAITAFEAGDPARARRLISPILTDAADGAAPVRPRLAALVLSARLAIADADDAIARADLETAVGEARATGSVGILVDAAETVTLLGGPDADDGDLLELCARARAQLALARDAWEVARWGAVPDAADAAASAAAPAADELAARVLARLWPSEHGSVRRGSGTTRRS
ncbi:BTAD domain-containing putative transcriptional regulator [Microbacterium thalassium]|uniref:Putative ATPase/DNA-binding SARP family transcriptional activator n=1 Tax=Microbacterium thalassium TaxID=362649 RepID=A0A7X0KU71_9MICO|nr:BTAD domain-containing putative transcriptional regulator [Microbacterium thalassium]MBB6390829.1 putative ATPase/DNA-binding SARP family transcriptional activator [Microbacterium thalassium]GLK25937.1 SARP family transcriptional regulator [Microbacterium thalassium]